MADAGVDERAEEALSAGLDALDRGDEAAVAAALKRLRRAVGAKDARTLYLRGQQAWVEAGPAAARRLLRAAVAAAPDDGDMHYALALACEAEGDEAGATRHMLQTRICDAARDRRSGIGDERDVARIERISAEVIDALPDRFRSRLHHVPVLLEPRPSLALVKSGFDPRAVGLFEGPGALDGDHVPAPTRIVLYTSNLLAEYGDDPDELRAQIEVTVLHEVGHYFGLEEEDMERLGLD